MSTSKPIPAQLARVLTGPAAMPETTLLWNTWIALQTDRDREVSDLKDLLASSVRIEFKQRALAILWSPDFTIQPYHWPDRMAPSSKTYLGINWNNTTIVPPELQRFAAELVCAYIDYVLGRPRLETELIRTLHNYNKLILQFLAKLSGDDELAQRLFDRYQLNDPTEYANMEDASGYNPFYEILTAETVPLKWKREADRKMRNIIVSENRGQVQPRNEWEGALARYIQHIQSAHAGGISEGIRGLLIEQLLFICGLPGIESHKGVLFESWHLARMLDVITGRPFRKARLKLARQAVLARAKQGYPFSAHNNESRRAAKMMLEDFGDEDLQLKKALETLVEEADNRAEEEAAEVEALEKKTRDLLEKMS